MRNLGFFECKCMPFRLCNAPTTFQRLMQNCPGELNLMYCLIYLDDVRVILKMERSTCNACMLCLIVSGNTKLKFFWNEINYLVHHVSKEGVSPSKENLKAVEECAPPQLTWKSKPSWAWWGTVSNSSRGFHVYYNSCMNIYLRKVLVRRMSE